MIFRISRHLPGRDGHSACRAELSLLDDMESISTPTADIWWESFNARFSVDLAPITYNQV